LTSSARPASSWSIWPCVSAKKPATGMPIRHGEQHQILGAQCQVPGSCQLVFLNSSSRALKLIAMG
jgi:hypothetical protein